MILSKTNMFKKIFSCLIVISFFLGYFFKENSAGGGPEFYDLSWPIIQSFKTDFLYTLENYGSFRDYTIPFSHILNSYLNPFSNNLENFQLSVTIISFIIFLIFYFVISKIYKETNSLDIFLLSSVILLSPFFRTSAFWGKNENYGWLFLILAFYFFYRIKEDISKSPNNKNTLNIMFFCFWSACALYSRQAFVFLPFSYFLYLFFNNANKKIIFTSIIFFAIFSIPGFFVIWFWGDVYPSLPEGMAPHGGLIGGYIQFINILKNFPILLSFFGFYFLPILFIEFYNLGYKVLVNKYFKSFFLSFAIFIFLSQTDLLNYLGEYTLAGGAILKVNYLIMKKNFLLLLLFSAIGFSVLFRLFTENPRNNLVILLPMLVIYGFPRFLYQEYVEPLILIIFFLTLKTDLQKWYFKNISFSNFILLAYFTLYLLGSIYFKHFAFTTFEQWKIFIEG